MSSIPSVIPTFLFLNTVPGPPGVRLALAFGAGVLTPFNPCGFALLPAYVSYTLGQNAADDEQADWRPLLRGGLLGLPLAGGFLLVFLVAGGVLALGGHVLVHVFPWLALLVGIGLVLLGGWTLFGGRTQAMPGLGAVAAKLGTTRSGTSETAERSPRAFFSRAHAAWLFGLGYGLSSLGCSLPIFLLIIGTAITASGAGSALLVLVAYAAGMTLVLLPVAMTATTLDDLFRHFVFPRLGWIQPVAAALVIAAGVYIVFSELRAGLW